MRIGACAPAARILRFMARILPHWPVGHLETIDEVVERYCDACDTGVAAVLETTGVCLVSNDECGVVAARCELVTEK